METIKDGLLLGGGIIIYIILVILFVRFLEKQIHKSELLQNFGNKVINKGCSLIDCIRHKRK